MPIFNRARILDHTLQTIIDQPGNWECILVDDHSTDHASEVCKKYIEKNDRFKYIVNQRTKGAPGARNTGVEIATGEYIYFFDSDNLLHDKSIEKIESELQRVKCDVLVFYGKVVNERRERVSSFRWKSIGNIREQLITGKTYVDNNLSVIKKECLTSIQLTDESVPSYQEWDTHIRLSETCIYHTLEEELIDYIKWEKDTISSNVERSIEGFLYVLEKHTPLFAQHENALLSFCVQIEELSKKIKEPIRYQKVMDRIKALMPNYSSKVRIQRLKSNYRVLIELVKRKLSFK